MDQLSISDRYGLKAENVLFIRNLVAGKVSLTGSDAIVADPRLSEPKKGNLKLTASSPAVDEADSRYVAPTDFAGRKRPSGKASDIGAYEFIP